MYILAIETTGAKCSVAITDENGKITELENYGKFAHLQSLVPMISELLESSELRTEDITAIAVSQGPGSFTGIRIGVTTARALAQALDIPVVAVPTLKSFVYHSDEGKGVVCPVFDARRNQVYGAAYIYDEKGVAIEIVKGGAYTLDDYMSLLIDAVERFEYKTLFFCGDGANAYSEAIESAAASAGLEAKISDVIQQASFVACLGLELYKQGQAVPYGLIQPDYMRESEAQRNLNLKIKAESECEGN
ncbi:MAG: tRNA (adenosine(37)-N6)-threonylcarbamoyltransferase complex dimerization subunit type 1 TsaB [Eubacteriales bacterium]|nr:tRNA (adenosine(37)-N6)-threonylcarbamoyltransferase complex dimerization subunit type 1 TsaB [Eubacteriales bacterium]MDD4390879.1 tRNA (adenosine(37)-N6)-threonylcarbamoyltransferase complex dimerization subunit type 1 TsaB [Eubacteriales bacterium]